MSSVDSEAVQLLRVKPLDDVSASVVINMKIGYFYELSKAVRFPQMMGSRLLLSFLSGNAQSMAQSDARPT